MHNTKNLPRLQAVVIFFILIAFLCASRLLYIQLFRSRYLSNIASQQHNMYVELEPLRGTIYDRNLKQLAVNLPCDSLYASPRDISNKQKVIACLKSILGLDDSYLNDRLYRDKSFVWLRRKLPAQKVRQIKEANLKGLSFVRESQRCYPNAGLASHVMGFAGLDNTGLEGIELYYDEYLKGTSGWAQVLRDARQNKLLWEKSILPKDGYDIVLTIDEMIQFIAERELNKVYQKFHAKGASIIVMDPFTGEILAMANRPTYSLNSVYESSLDSRRNRALADMFEPGSVFKIVTASAALEEGKFNEADKLFCENGAYRVANHILHDHVSHGWLTFSEVIMQSSNIGTTKIAQALGAQVIYKYADAFGFGKKTGIDLPGEIPGVLKPVPNWSKTSIGAVPIGQEVGVTAIQLACAISVIANGGKLMKPYVVKQLQDVSKEVIKEFEPQEVRRVISEEAALRVKKILTRVIEEGTGKLAKIEGMKVAGKTGTAQKVEPGGMYSHEKFIASFIGFAPADKPLVAIVICIDEPHPYYFGGVVAGPVFKKVAEDVVRYLSVNGKGKNLSTNYHEFLQQ